LEPGHTVTQDIELPGVDLSPDRFESGNYAVFSGRVSAVFFDDGEVIGDQHDLIEQFIARRVAEVAATIRLREHLLELVAAQGDGEELLAAVHRMVAEDKVRNPRRTPLELMAEPKTEDHRSKRREQHAWSSALSAARFFLVVAKQVGPREAFAQALSRLEIVIANGLRNLPAAEREALQ
jgi:hypothetical protein